MNREINGKQRLSGNKYVRPIKQFTLVYFRNKRAESLKKKLEESSVIEGGEFQVKQLSEWAEEGGGGGREDD